MRVSLGARTRQRFSANLRDIAPSAAPMSRPWTPVTEPPRPMGVSDGGWEEESVPVGREKGGETHARSMRHDWVGEPRACAAPNSGPDRRRKAEAWASRPLAPEARGAGRGCGSCLAVVPVFFWRAARSRAVVALPARTHTCFQPSPGPCVFRSLTPFIFSLFHARAPLAVIFVLHRFLLSWPGAGRASPHPKHTHTRARTHVPQPPSVALSASTSASALARAARSTSSARCTRRDRPNAGTEIRRSFLDRTLAARPCSG